MDTYCTWMHGCISGLIRPGSFSNQFKQGLGDYYGCFMLIRRGAGSFKCYFWIFEILENLWSWLGAVLWWGLSPRFLCFQLEFLCDFFTEERSYQGLKDATSFGLLSDKSAEILGSKYSIFRQILHTGRFGHFRPSWAWLKSAESDITSSRKTLCGRRPVWRIFQFFEYLDLNKLAVLAD